MADEPEDPTTPVAVANPEPLPGLALPEYHGRPASGMKSSIGGAGNRITRPHEIGDRVVLVVEAIVRKAGHEETDDGLLYVETLKTKDLFEIQGPAGKRLLSTVRQAYRTADDAAKGRAPLSDDGLDLGTHGVTDGSGVALTADELAELRGDPVRAALADGTTPVVVVYSDGARELWPDEFEKDAPRPVAGERFEIDGQDGPADYVYVEELLDAGSGERLAHWTKEQEDARLLELEHKAAEVEAAEEADDERPVYFEVAFEDGSVEEIPAAANFPGVKPESSIPADTLARATRVHAVTADGSKMLLSIARNDGVDELEPLDPGTAPLPGEEGFGDGLEPLNPPEGTGTTPADDPDPGIPQPGPDDFAFVDRPIGELGGFLAQVDDLDEARRALEAEKQGRGRKLKTRQGAVDLILARIAELEKAPTDG